ncbi:MAG: hypothetical protein AAGK74_00070 [Chloroflexota bacterium]
MIGGRVAESDKFLTTEDIADGASVSVVVTSIVGNVMHLQRRLGIPQMEVHNGAIVDAELVNAVSDAIEAMARQLRLEVRLERAKDGDPLQAEVYVNALQEIKAKVYESYGGK